MTKRPKSFGLSKIGSVEQLGAGWSDKTFGRIWTLTRNCSQVAVGVAPSAENGVAAPPQPPQHQEQPHPSPMLPHKKNTRIHSSPLNGQASWRVEGRI